MLTPVLSRLIHTFLTHFRDDTFVVQKLHDLSEIYSKVSPNFVGLTIDLNDASDITRRCREIAKEIEGEVRKFKDRTKASKLFSEIEHAIHNTQEFASQLPVESLDISRHLQDFSNAYDDYIQTHRTDKAAVLIVQAHRTYGAITAFRNILSSVAQTISPQSADLGDDKYSLEILFAYTTDISLIAQKLSAIVEAYNILCEACSVDSMSHPLQIVKIESGSLFINVVGALLPLKLLEGFIQKAATILYRRFVLDGKIEAENEKRRMIEEAVGLRNALKDAGINTSSIDERIGLLARRHAEKLCELLYAEPSVELNGVETRLGDHRENAYLEEVQIRRLAHSPEKLDHDESNSE